ncbi:hypothetical protein [Campylobacter hyointestinalis]|uniref:Uncharacterized protein n=1 Tax=Campylobacter hyointestinalis subsp. hyointestinalis TaxID=91352 RepID=A0A855N2D6_CAMHY|nr:hypothetical protein [Campylobacter hyointestinalis]PPB58460.1 hypothetical protein CDQ70_05275 [Campylobacter hyointestinalis subsp. hyointestinalis]PPB62922.1 hypothetical protein CDQ74_06020 [Campylobacter hyointestinalis subsp. hyointestinalis]PPB71313.1 hypothetical protein CDQ78_06435 [Campylobacter hyointestinalis subsp. hyointestinalis]
MELLPDLKYKLNRHALGNGLAKAGLKESLHKFIQNVICEDEKLTIVFNHNMAKFEFEHSKEQFLEGARKYYKAHAKEFESLNFIPKRIEAKVEFKEKDAFKFDPLSAPTPRNEPKKKATPSFENRAKDQRIYAGFERIREVIKTQKGEQND